MSAREMALDALIYMRKIYLYGAGWDCAQDKADKAIAAIKAELSEDGFTGMSEEADFLAGTWTFKMQPGYRVGAGQYRITPILSRRDAAPEINSELLEALRIAEAALADIGDSDHAPEDDFDWCEIRAAKALPKVRAAIARADKGKS